MTHSISLKNFNTTNLSKVIMSVIILSSLVYLGSAVVDSHVVSILQDQGVNVPDGLATGLAAATSVAEVQTLLVGAAIAVPSPVQWAIAGAGVASL